jgi:hypothetical protein
MLEEIFMFCKNCGNDLGETAEVCMKCGFAKGTGNKFCETCGKEVQEGQAICIGCGCALKPLNTATETQSAPVIGDKYKEYIPTVKKNSIFQLVHYGVQLLLIISVIFLPIFTCPDLTAFAFGLESANFSIFSEFCLMIDMLFSNESLVALIAAFDPTSKWLVLFMSIFAIFAVVTAIVSIIQIIIGAVKEIKALTAIDTTTMMVYSDMLKPGYSDTDIAAKYKKKSFAPTVFGLVVADVAIIVICKIVFKQMETSTFSIATLRCMQDINGVSALIAVVAVALVATIVFSILMKNEEKQMLINIKNGK